MIRHKSTLHSRPFAGMSQQPGFTLVELLVAILVIGLAAVLGLPALWNLTHKIKVEGANREARSLMQSARFEAIKRGVPTVVAIDPALRELVSFVDVHGATLTDPSDGIFNPLGAPPGVTDSELARYPLPVGLDFRFQAATGLASIEGFLNTGNPDPPDQRAIFLPDGSSVAEGAFRIGDERGNYLEVRVRPALTARMEVRKWDGVAWRAFGEEGKPWTWR